MLTSVAQKKMGEICIGEQVFCFDEATKTYCTNTVIHKTETAAGIQKVYNMQVGGGNTFIMNNVMVLQK